MSRMIKFLWLLSVLLFTVTLFWVYAYLPVRIGVMAGSEGITDTFVTKGVFFYGSLLFFLLVNGLLFIMRRMLASEKQPLTGTYPAGLRSDLADWMLGFAACVNLFFILAMFYLTAFNSPEGMNQGFYGPLVYTGPVLIVLSLFVLVYLFFKKRN